MRVAVACLALLSIPALASGGSDAVAARDAFVAVKDGGVVDHRGRALIPADAEVEAIFDDAIVVSGLGELGAAGDGDDAEVRVELLRETLMGAFDAFGVTGGVAVIDADTGLVFGFDDDEAARAPTVPTRRPRRPAGEPREKTERLPFGGALVGKRIAISAGHGWLRGDTGAYNTQRSVHRFSASARGIVEDFFTAEFVSNQLMPLLQGMGAELVMIRVPDHDEAAELRVDVSAGSVVSGDVDIVSAAGSVGGAHLRARADGEGLIRVAIGAATRAERRVGIRFPVDDNAAAAVVVTVAHAGGARVFNLDPGGAAGAVVDLGSYVTDSASVVEVAAAPAVGRLVVDAVEIGSGVHADSDKPWWQMSAAQTVAERRGPGVPSAVSGRGDVTVRPAYAELFDIDAFISIHANAAGTAGGSSANGLSIYRYSCQTFSDHSSSTSATSCDDPPGSTDLIDDVFASTLGELRASWDPNFGDRGRRVANFGELRDLVDTPGILIETAFFDNLADPSGSPPPRMSDNRALHDPRFRERFAVGVARGLARFFDASADAPPERPTGVVAENVDGAVVVTFDAVAGAAGYRVRRARLSASDGLLPFDEGVITTTTTLSFDDVEAGEVFVVDVSAMNDNGEGYASQGVAVRVGPTHALVVDAYDRRDAFVQDVDNSLHHSSEHVAALAAALVSRADAGGVDGALDEAVVAGRVALGDYAFVDVMCGKDSTEHEAVGKDLQGPIASYVAGGGRLFLSGEEVGFALVERSIDPDDEVFIGAVLGATYVEDDADTFSATLLGVPVSLDDGSGGVYEVKFPDVVAAAAGATVVGTYADGRGAMVQKGNVLFLGTPFEALIPQSARATVMTEVLDAVNLPGIAGEGEGEGEGEGDEGEGEGDGEGEGEPGEGEGEGEQLDRLVIQTTGGAQGGCGCSTTSTPSSLAPAFLGLGVLWTLRRRRL